MKKLFSFISVFALAAILGISTVSAQKTVATVEKLWSKTTTEMGSTVADTRQGTGVDGKVYLLNKANQSLVAVSAEGQDTLCVGPLAVAEGVSAALDGTAYALDDAANFVMEGTFPNTPSHLVLRKADGSVVKDLAIAGLARTDFINATGDLFSAEGGHVFVYGNSANLLVYTIANGELVGEPVEVAAAGSAGNNYVIAGDANVQIVHHRTSEAGWLKVENGAATLIEGMEGFKKTTMGGDIITLAGKEFYIYPAGATNYDSEFAVRNMTDGVFVVDKADGVSTSFKPNADAAVSSTITACWLNASKIDDNNAYVHVYNSQGAAAYKLSVTVAATITLNVNDPAMGTVEGAGEVAVGGNATVKAIPALGHSFVAWKNGEDVVSTDAEYTFAVTGDVTLTAVFQAEANKTLTLAVNDPAMGAITLPEGLVMGENSVLYGTVVALTAVPAEGATFNGWFNGAELYSSEYTINLAVTADLALTAQFSKSLILEYDLGGGVTNAYGWLSKAHMCLDFQNDYNAAYNTTKAWAKEENGVVYYNINNTWKLPEEVEGTAADVTSFLQNATYNTSDNLVKLLQTEKWLPLGEYINGLRTAAGNAVADEGAMRADLSGFFLNSPAITDYRHTNDYAIAGQPATFCPAMKMGFDNPTEVTREITLNTPYHATLTFYGWYAAADFSGEKYTKVDPSTVVPGGKLYAKFDEYIPSIAEVMAMEEGVETKVSGVVNWVRAGNVFIQDATGGFLLYAKGLTAEVGTKIIAKGTRGSFNGSPQLSGAVIVSTEKGELYPVVSTDLATLCGDSTALKYFGQRVQVLGVQVAEFDQYGNVYLTDGANKVKCHYMTPDQNVFTIGKKVDIVAVASQYQGAFQFEGDVKGLTVTVIGKKDTYAYPQRHGKYNLVNKWVISVQEENFAANAPGNDQMVRGMAAKDGIMYFISREKEAIVRVDGATGEMLEPLKITGEHLFEVEGEDGTWSAGVTLKYNDIKFDSEGNCLISGCITSQNQHFMVYVVDLETGEAELLISEKLGDNPDYAEIACRFDAFGVNGDVYGNACIMAADALGSFNTYRWLIEDGEVGQGELISILLDPETDKSNLIDSEGNLVAGWGTAPQIFPQDEYGSLFYVDGFNTLPTLFDEGGMLVEDFIKCPHGKALWNNPGDTTTLAVGLNGIQEFQVGDDYFMVMIATHTPSSPPSAFGLYKFADEARSFDGLEPLWYFPNKGMGGASNGVRTAVPTVEVDGNKATIYLYAQNNGYAVYEFIVDENYVGPNTGVENVEVELGARKMIENGQVIILKNGVKYNVLGAEVK